MPARRCKVIPQLTVDAATVVMATGNGFLRAVIILVTIIQFPDFCWWLFNFASVCTVSAGTVGWGVMFCFVYR